MKRIQYRNLEKESILIFLGLGKCMFNIVDVMQSRATTGNEMTICAF